MVEVGTEVGYVVPGDEVLTTWIPRSPLEGRPPVPSRVVFPGGDEARTHNTFAWGTHALVDEQWVVKAPESTPPDLGAVIGCALMTGAGAVMNTAAVRPGQSVVVWGAGGVGLCALAGASILGAAPVVAVDIDDDKLRLAKQFGATAVVNARMVDPVEAIREMTRNADGTRGADVVLDCTGLGRNIPTSLAAVRPGIRGSGIRGGSAVLVGIPRSSFELNAMDLLNGEKDLLGCVGGSCNPLRDFPTFAGWVRDGRFDPSALVTDRYSLDELNTAVEDLHYGRVRGRAVVELEHSPLPSVERARAFLAERDADAVVAVGGGSSVVTARAATILLGEGRDVRELCTRREADGRLVSPKLAAPKLPQWVVPSSPTTAYAKAGAAVRDPATGERLALFDPKARAQGVVLDPVMALTAPPRLSWSAALNILSMAVEGLQSARVDPLADALLAHAVRTVVTWLPRVSTEPDQAAPRLQLMLAAVMSGQGSDHTGGGLAQALSHAIGPRSSAPNGVVEALLLPQAMRFNAEVAGDRLAAMADYLGLFDRKADAVIAEVERLLEVFEAPRRLRDIGVAQESLAEVVEHAMDDWAITAGPRLPDAQDVRELLASAY